MPHTISSISHLVYRVAILICLFLLKFEGLFCQINLSMILVQRHRFYWNSVFIVSRSSKWRGSCWSIFIGFVPFFHSQKDTIEQNQSVTEWHWALFEWHSHELAHAHVSMARKINEREIWTQLSRIQRRSRLLFSKTNNHTICLRIGKHFENVRAC